MPVSASGFGASRAAPRCSASLMSMPSSVATGADAEKGYQYLLTKPYDAPIMTEAMLWDVWKVWPEPARTEAEQASPAERRQMIFSRYGLVEEQGRDLPVSFAQDARRRFDRKLPCCHAGKVAGKYILRAGKLELHRRCAGFGRRLIDAAGKPGAAAGNRRLAGRLSRHRNPSMQSASTMRSASLQYLLAMRDKDLNLQAVPQYPLPPASLFIPDKTPAWWGTKRKKFLYWDGFAQTVDPRRPDAIHRRARRIQRRQSRVSSRISTIFMLGSFR